jgi:hypothetical protein
MPRVLSLVDPKDTKTFLDPKDRYENLLDPKDRYENVLDPKDRYENRTYAYLL